LRLAAHLAARVELDAMRVNGGVDQHALLQNNRERKAPEDRSPPFLQQLARPCWVARVERLSVVAEYKNQRDSFLPVTRRSGFPVNGCLDKVGWACSACNTADTATGF